MYRYSYNYVYMQTRHAQKRGGFYLSTKNQEKPEKSVKLALKKCNISGLEKLFKIKDSGHAGLFKSRGPSKSRRTI